jgi:hypothetical protein
LGQLTPLYIPHSNFLVYPFVGALNEMPSFKPDPFEVEQVVEIPLDILSNPKTISSIVVGNGDLAFDAPCYLVQGHCIWGATAMILSEFMTVVQPLMSAISASLRSCSAHNAPEFP